MKFDIGKQYNLVISVFGRRGSGKTTLCTEISKAFKKIVVYDTCSRIDVRSSNSSDTFLPGALKIHADFGPVVETIVKNRNGFKIIFTPSEPENDFDFFCELMNTKEINETLIYVEEVGLLARPNAPLSSSFNKLLRFGRHHGIHLLVNAQRPVDVHRAITANSSHIICFKQTEPRDLGYLSGFFGERTDSIKNLPEHHFVCWKDGGLSSYDQNRNLIDGREKSARPRIVQPVE